MAGLVFLQCMTHPGYLDHSLRRHVSGQEVFKRLAVIALEDGFALTLPLTVMLALVAIVQNHADWKVPLHFVRAGVVQCMRMQASTRFVPWKHAPPRDSARGKKDALVTAPLPPAEWGSWPEWEETDPLHEEDLQNSLLLLQRTGAMAGDLAMFQQCWRQRSEWEEPSRRMHSGKSMPLVMPPWHAVDGHAFPSSSYFVPSSRPLPELGSGLFATVTGHNPRKGLEVWQESSVEVQRYRLAQRLVLKLLHGPTAPPALEVTVLPGPPVRPTDPLDYAHLSAAIGHRTLLVQGKSVLVALPVEEGMDMTVILKPERARVLDKAHRPEEEEGGVSDALREEAESAFCAQAKLAFSRTYPIHLGRHAVFCKGEWCMQPEDPTVDPVPWSVWCRQYPWPTLQLIQWQRPVAQWPLEQVLERAVDLARITAGNNTWPYIVQDWESQVRQLCADRRFRPVLFRVVAWTRHAWSRIELTPASFIGSQTNVSSYPTDNTAFHFLCHLCCLLPGVLALSSSKLPCVDIRHVGVFRSLVQLLSLAARGAEEAKEEEEDNDGPPPLERPTSPRPLLLPEEIRTWMAASPPPTSLPPITIRLPTVASKVKQGTVQSFFAPRSNPVRNKGWEFAMDVYDRGERTFFPAQAECIQELNERLDKRPDISTHMVFGACGLGKTTVLARALRHLYHKDRLPKYVLYLLPEANQFQSIQTELEANGVSAVLFCTKKKLVPFRVNILKRSEFRDMFSEGTKQRRTIFQRDFLLQHVDDTLLVPDEVDTLFRKSQQSAAVLEYMRLVSLSICASATLLSDGRPDEYLPWLQLFCPMVPLTAANWPMVSSCLVRRFVKMPYSAHHAVRRVPLSSDPQWKAQFLALEADRSKTLALYDLLYNHAEETLLQDAHKRLTSGGQVVLLARNLERENYMIQWLQRRKHRVADFSQVTDTSFNCVVGRIRLCGRGVNGAQRFDHVMQSPVFSSSSIRHHWEHRFLRPGQRSRVVQFDTYVVAGSLTERLLTTHDYADVCNAALRQSAEKGSWDDMERAAIAMAHAAADIEDVGGGDESDHSVSDDV